MFEKSQNFQDIFFFFYDFIACALSALYSCGVDQCECFCV